MCGQAGSWSLLGGSSLRSGWHFQARSHIAPGRAQGSIKTESCREGNPSSLPSSSAPLFTLNSSKYLFQLYLGSFKTNVGDPSRWQWGLLLQSLLPICQNTCPATNPGIVCPPWKPVTWLPNPCSPPLPFFFF